MLKHPVLRPMLVKQVKAQQAVENINFLDALKKNAKLPDVFDTFIKPGSKQSINISSSLRRKMVELAEQDDWKKVQNEFRRSLSSAVSEIHVLLDGNFVHLVFKSDAFKQYCFKLAGTPEKAGKLIGLTNTKDLATLLMQYHTDIVIDGKQMAKKLEELRQKQMKKGEKAKGVGTQMFMTLQRKGFIA